jgi:hypothetical protein
MSHPQRCRTDMPEAVLQRVLWLEQSQAASLLPGRVSSGIIFVAKPICFTRSAKLRCDFSKLYTHSQNASIQNREFFTSACQAFSAGHNCSLFTNLKDRGNRTPSRTLKLQRRCPRTVSRHTHSNISVSTAATRTSSSCNARWHGGAMYTHIDRWTTPYSQTLLASTCSHTPHMFGQISRMYPKRRSQGKNPARRAHREMV